MKIGILTKDKNEFSCLEKMTRDVLKELGEEDEIEHCDTLETIQQNTQKHKYNIVLLAFPGAYGLETMVYFRDHHAETKVIWIAEDKYFGGVAMRYKVADFLVKPISEIRFREAMMWCVAPELYGLHFASWS